jgi:hypothetical protein
MDDEVPGGSSGKQQIGFTAATPKFSRQRKKEERQFARDAGDNSHAPRLRPDSSASDVGCPFAKLSEFDVGSVRQSE